MKNHVTNTDFKSKIQNPKSKIQNLYVLTAYFLLTTLMTWPTILHLTDGIPGDGFDGWQNYWNLWWVKQALLVESTNPFFTSYLDAPNGVSLLFHTLNIFNGLWTLPVQLNFGLAVAYNSVVFFSFVLAGYGGYLLSLYTLSRLFPSGRGLRMAAFVGGLVFTMSPFHMAHLLGHMQVFSMIWPAFYILWLLRILEPWRTPRDDVSPYLWRNTAISALFLILSSLVAWYHTLYLFIFTGTVLLWTIWQRRRPLSASALQPLWVVLAIGVSFGIFLSPLLLPMIRAASARPDLETGLVQNITLSADLLAFITPSELHPLWGQWAKDIADNFSSTTSERLIFAGFVPLALATFIIIRAWSSLIVRFWALMTAIFFVISLGPFLHIGGKILAIGDWQIPMPYLLLYHTVPFIDLTRSLSRYDSMIMLSLGVLVATALAQLQLTISKYQLPITNYQLPILATVLILFEFLPIPYPISKIDTPQFYFDISHQPEDYTIAELPMNWDRPTPLLHQTTHGKRLLTAYTSRSNPLELASRTPVLQHWRNLGPDIIDQPLQQIAPTIFFDFNLRYIVLDYWQMPPGPERESTERWVAAALPPGTTPIYDDGRLKVYQTPSKEATYPYLSLGDGWNKREDHGNGLITRTFAANQAQSPELFLHHPDSQQPLALEITVATGQENTQTLTIFAGDVPIGQFPVGKVFTSHTIPIPPLDDSLVELKLKTSNPIGQIIVRRVGLRVRE